MVVRSEPLGDPHKEPAAQCRVPTQPHATHCQLYSVEAATHACMPEPTKALAQAKVLYLFSQCDRCDRG